MILLLLHAADVLATLGIAGWCFERMVHRREVPPGGGGILVLALTLWGLAYGLILAGAVRSGPMAPFLLEGALLRVNPALEHQALPFLGLAGAALALSGFFNLMRNHHLRRSLLRQALDPEREAEEDPAWLDLLRLQERLEVKFRSLSGLASARVRISDRTRMPLTLGVRRTTLICPLWMFQPETAETLRLLIHREAFRVRRRRLVPERLLECCAGFLPAQRLAKPLRLLMEVLDDRRFLEDLDPAGREAFRSALRQVARTDGPGPALPPEGPDLQVRADLASRRGRTAGWRLAALPLIPGVSLFAALCLGPILAGDLGTERFRSLGEGLRLEDPGGLSRVVHIPGGRGLVIDTDHRRHGHCCLSWQEGAQDLARRMKAPCVELTLDLEVERHPQATAPVLLGASTQEVRMDVAAGLKRRLMLADRVLPLAEGRQSVRCLARFSWPDQDTVEAWGPCLCVPRGWRVRILGAALRPAGMEAFQAWVDSPGLAICDTWLNSPGEYRNLHLDWSTEW